MATASTVALDPAHRPVFAVAHLAPASAARTSALLQANHDAHDMFFNDRGFHNHIVHHHLALYALGATEAELDAHYRFNAAYQRDPVPAHAAVDMTDAAVFARHLGDKAYYRDYLAYFKAVIERDCVPAVLQRELFARSARADDLLARTYGGLLHPIIHLGYGLEFAQPLVTAEALAQAAVHETKSHPLFLETEQLARAAPAPTEPPSMLALLQQAAADPVLSTSVQTLDPGALHTNLIQRDGARLFALAAQYTVAPATLHAQTLDMLATSAYLTVCAQRPATHMPKLDFFLVHTLNCAIFYPRLAELAWLAPADRARLLEFKVRMDLANYLARGTPALHGALLDEYTPQHPGETWDDVMARVRALPEDDGHAAKAIRALAACERLCGESITLRGAPGHADVRLERRHWLLMAQLAMDAYEAPGPRHVRGAGVDEAWAEVPRAVARM